MPNYKQILCTLSCVLHILFIDIHASVSSRECLHEIRVDVQVTAAEPPVPCLSSNQMAVITRETSYSRLDAKLTKPGMLLAIYDLDQSILVFANILDTREFAIIWDALHKPFIEQKKDLLTLYYLVMGRHGHSVFDRLSRVLAIKGMFATYVPIKTYVNPYRAVKEWPHYSIELSSFYILIKPTMKEKIYANPLFFQHDIAMTTILNGGDISDELQIIGDSDDKGDVGSDIDDVRQFYSVPASPSLKQRGLRFSRIRLSFKPSSFFGRKGIKSSQSESDLAGLGQDKPGAGE